MYFISACVHFSLLMFLRWLLQRSNDMRRMQMRQIVNRQTRELFFFALVAALFDLPLGVFILSQ